MLFWFLDFLGAWFKPDGSLRNVHWTPPESVSVDYLGSVPVLPARNAIDMGRVVAMTDRPLFVPGRRPPPPPPPSGATEEAPVDNLSTAKILGVYEGNGAGGVVMNIWEEPPFPSPRGGRWVDAQVDRRQGRGV